MSPRINWPTTPSDVRFAAFASPLVYHSYNWQIGPI
jgi:hypothetical protein